MAAAAASTAIQRDAAPGLSEITNKENAKTASFPVVVKNSHIQIYSYTSHNKQQEGAKLVCILQCENGTDYCLGVAKMQGKDKAELKNLLDASWQENTVWRLSEIVLLPEEPQWIHTNIRLIILTIIFAIRFQHIFKNHIIRFRIVGCAALLLGWI